jgi:hypothetical protein
MIPARMRPGKPVITAAVAATALIGGAGVALAATSSSSSPQRTASRAGTAVATPLPSPSPSSSRCQVKMPRRGFPPPMAGFAIHALPVPFGLGPFGAPFGAIHGQFVAPKPGGGYQTIDTQRGTVTAVSTSSITVKSSDGFTKTYQVTSSTNVDAQRAGIGSVETGQTVSVLATVSGSSATATQIVDFAVLPKPFAVPQAVLPRFSHILPNAICANWSTSLEPGPAPS